MIITKRVERLYALAQYENIKVVYEAQEEIGTADPSKAYERLSTLLQGELKKDALLYKQTPKG